MTWNQELGGIYTSCFERYLTMPHVFLKLAALTLVLVSHRPTTRPPNPAPGKSDEVHSWQLYDYIVRYIGLFSQVRACTLASWTI